ncbi:MAG: tRNA (cytidine(34)-2'-O)-methyltransferase [Gemmatimonadaceae bacterium]|jgi:tRNA (cytidine/uridine-2'-O-)-methyltransferase|nr:tRNA (cytidine(34)-2'-O)-methyltransferase [Gemmatimonadaceae bacterium]
MIDVVLYTPEIPPNTGNSIRLCANTGARLHLVEPLGFHFADKQLTRAGLDYHDLADVRIHRSWDACRAHLGDAVRWFAFTTRGTTRFTDVTYVAGDVLVFGPESVGLPDHIEEQFAPAHRLRVPMLPARRSINLSNTVAIAVYEAWRQQGFTGGA